LERSRRRGGFASRIDGNRSDRIRESKDAAFDQSEFQVIVATPAGTLPEETARVKPGSSFFTAASPIGFLAGAGNVVRNSIRLVDFIQLRLKEGMPLDPAVTDAGAVPSPRGGCSPPRGAHRLAVRPDIPGPGRCWRANHTVAPPAPVLFLVANQ
jgi:hypothetical protein